MTSEDYSMAPTSPVNLRQAAMDLARRLSSLRDFIPAANELITCSDLPAQEVRRHCRKIVTLIEIARTTLTRSGIRLHQLSTCMPALARHKTAYFSMLHMLQKQRHLMQDDQVFQDRVDRLLLSLSANVRAAVSEETAHHPSAHACFNNVADASDPSLRASVAVQGSRLGKGGSVRDGQMLRHTAPDVLLGRPVKSWNLDVRKAIQSTGSSQSRRQSWRESSRDEYEEGSDDDDDESRPVVLQPPRRRFGIFCTGQQGPQRLGGLRR